MSLARLAAELALPKSSVHGLCNTLVSFGYLRRQPDGAFLIGPRVMGLAEAFVSGTDVAQEFNALWADERPGPEETVVLSVLTGTMRSTSACATARGRSASPSTSACACRPTSRAAARRCSPSCRRRGAAPLRRPACDAADAQGPARLDALLKELALTRQRGYSVDDEAVREGVYSFGAPVFDASGEAVAGDRGLHQQGAARQRSRRAPPRAALDVAAA